MNHRVLREINQITDDNCQGCQIRKTIKRSQNDRAAYQYCTEICPVGHLLKVKGRQLETDSADSAGEDLDRNTYTALSIQNITDREICTMYDMGATTLHRRKREWGLRTKPSPDHNVRDYMAMKKQGMLDTEICDAWRLSKTTLWRRKKEWGLI